MKRSRPGSRPLLALGVATWWLFALPACQSPTVAPEPVPSPAESPTLPDLGPSETPTPAEEPPAPEPPDTAAVALEPVPEPQPAPAPAPAAPDPVAASAEGGEGSAAAMRAPAVAEPVTVALLVPLSGTRAELGAALLDAAQLALFDLADRRLVLRPYDTGDTAPGAAAAAERALADGAQLILGPVFSAATTAVAAPARARGVNVIAFSNDRTAIGSGVFLMGFFPDQQVGRVLRFARERGLQRIAALLPQTDYGAEVTLALERWAAQLGLAVGDIVQYAADASDGDAAVRTLAKRRQTFDAVLLPEGGATLRQIAPLLPYYDVDPAVYRFLGTYLWLDVTLGREPALVGGWFAGPALDSHEAFGRRFALTYGREPPRLASVAYDAMALATALGRRGEFSADVLTNSSGFKGIDGIFRFGPDGVAERGLAVIEVTPNGLTEVAPAPSTFQELTQ